MATETTELTQLLIDSQSPLQATRSAAEQKLLVAEETSFAEYLTALSSELSSENRPSVVRQLAGIVLKNAISGTEPLIDGKKREKWVQLSPEVTSPIKSSVLSVLQSNCEEARSAACQVIAKVARLDLACNKWPELLPFLMQSILNREIPITHKRACVTAVGYLCDDINTLSQELSIELLQNEQKNTLMTIVTHCVCDTNEEVALAGCKAFYYALLFARDNMANEAERNFILQIVGKCLNNNDLRIQHAAWECVLQIASEYYQFLDKYAGDLGKHSIETIKRYITVSQDCSIPEDQKQQCEMVSLAALEFWNTICDVEIILSVDEEKDESQEQVLYHFIRQAKPILLPILFEAMTTQGLSDPDLEEWTLAMAAGTCVSLCSQVLQDEILQPALEFVNSNFADRNWKRREAAVLAYGSIMEGPSSQQLEPLVQQSFQHLCRALNDESAAVRDSTAWTVGRIASFHTRCIIPLLGSPEQPGLMALLLEKLGDVPRVAAFVCFAIHEIARNQRPSIDAPKEDHTTSLFDPFFSQIASTLLTVAQKPEATEGNLRSAAFEALSEVIAVVGLSEKCRAVIEAVMKELMLWLENSFTLPPCDEISQVQGLICGCLNNITDRLGTNILCNQPQIVDSLFQLYTRVIETTLASAANELPSVALNSEGRATTERFGRTEERSKGGSEEDAILAIGTLLRVSGVSFERHLPSLSQLLAKGLQNPNEIRFCRACIGVVCEIAVVFDLKSTGVHQIITQLLPILFNLLQMNEAPVSLKPSLITTIGDIAVGMEKGFEPYLEAFLALLNRAACTKISDGPASEDWVEYLQELRNSVLEAFSSMIHGSREANLLNMLKPHVSNWLNFIKLVIEDPFSSTDNITRAIEVTGDLVTCYRSELVSHLVEMPFYHKMIETGFNAQNEELKKCAVFLQSAVVRCGGKAT